MDAIYRYIAFNDWVTLACVFALILLVIAKKTSAYHFRKFLLLIVSDNYIKTHKEDTSKKRIHYSLTLFQGLIIPLLIFVSISKFNKWDTSDWLFYLKIVGMYIVFYSCKFLLEKSLGFFTGYNMQVSSYLFQKQTYFNYIAVCIFPFLLGIIYSSMGNPLIIYVFLSITVFLLLSSITLVISNHRKLFYSKPYYFILYLCAFEIAPCILIFILYPK